MAILGFRRPQFSEEAAWLPEWLQNSQATPFDKLTKESEIKVFQEDGDENKASQDGHYDNCCLFLSGADKSVSSFASPSASVLHLNLHLSSDGNLQYTQSLSLNNYQVDTAKASTSQSGRVILPREVIQNTTQLYSHGILGAEDLLTKVTTTANPEVVPKSLFSQKKSKMKMIEDGSHKYDRFDHAVELSIAASEALLIHELLENEESLEMVDASALLDISLKVKQARLLWAAEDSSANDQLDESSEYLSDVDDSAMFDAFADVGLCTTSSGDCYVGDSIFSRVNESPQTELEDGCNFGQSEFLTPEVAMNCATERLAEGNLDMDREVKFMDGQYPITKCDFDGLDLITSGQENTKLETTQQQAGFNMSELESLPTQPHLAANSSQPHVHNAPEDYQLKRPPLGEFNSCLFGVGTRKDDYPGLILDTRKCTTKALAFQTSSLSESVEVPDKSSYVVGQDYNRHMASLQACSAANAVPSANLVKGEPLISPEIAKFSNSLSVDPLCSVVPCSYLSETPQSVHSTPIFQKGGGYLDENDPCFTSKLVPDRLNLTSEHIVEVQCMTTLNDKGSDLEVRRQLGSLNKYSVVLLNRNEMGKVPVSHEQLLIQRVKEKESCYSKTSNITCGNAMTAAPYIKSTSGAYPCSEGQPSIGNLTDGVTVCNNNAEGGARFLTFPPEQQISVSDMKGRNLLQASAGLCSDKKLDCTASQRVLDDSLLRKKSHAPQTGVAPDVQVLQRKRVHFKEDASELEQSKWFLFKKIKTGSEFVSNLKSKMLQTSNLEPERETFSQEVKKKLTNYLPCNGDKLIFRGLEFLLTGLPKKREKEVKQLIIRYGGIVLFDIPSPDSKGKIGAESQFQKLPIILCVKKVETTKFLYGCAVNASILKVDWLLDSVSAGSVLQPEKYMIFSSRTDGKHIILRSPHSCQLVFEGVGIMLHGNHRFCTRLSRIFKYGGGWVFKALQLLVRSSERKKLTIQAVVAEDISMVSRHLKHCAVERNIPIVSATWIISSLLSGKLLPFTENGYNFPKPIRKAPREMLPLSSCLSQEI